MWVRKVSDGSKMMPRLRTVGEGLTCTPSISIDRSEREALRDLVSIIKMSVSSVLSLRKLVLIQVLMSACRQLESWGVGVAGG